MKNKEQVLLRMKEDILLRGLSPNTLESYTSHARIFLDFCNRPTEQLNEHDIRNFLWYLIKEKKSSPGTVNTYSAAIRFLFAVTFNRTLNYLQIPRQKKRKTFPEVLTREEVSAIIESCQNLKHKAMLMVIYSSGLRVSEAAEAQSISATAKIIKTENFLSIKGFLAATNRILYLWMRLIGEIKPAHRDRMLMQIGNQMITRKRQLGIRY